MQNRYVGDIGDFGKYGLLRAHFGRKYQIPLRLGVVWYLFPDEPPKDPARAMESSPTTCAAPRQRDRQAP